MKLLTWIRIVCAGLSMCAVEPAIALDPALAVTQYKHTRWTIDEGAPRSIRKLAQGSDGYLWIASATGLFRFDGLTFESVQQHSGTEAGMSVSALLAARNGDLWVGYAAGGTAIYRNGKLRDVPMPDPGYVMNLVQTPKGVIWAAIGRKQSQLARFAQGRWLSIGLDWGLSEEHMVSLLAARDGTVWVATAESIYRLPDGSRRFERADFVVKGHVALSEDGQGRIWLSDLSGSRVIDAQALRASVEPRFVYPTPGAQRATRTVFDRNGNLWGITDAGLFRVRAPFNGAASTGVAAARVTRFQRKDGLSADHTSTIIEDREGNIWIGTSLGLDRLRNARVVVEPALTTPGLWGDILLAASDGAVYVAEADAVYRIRPGGGPQIFLQARATQALCEGPDASIWIVLQDRVIRRRGSETITLPGLGKTDQGITDCAVDRNGKVWMTALRDGLIDYHAGKWRRSFVPPPRGGFAPSTVLSSRKHGMLVAFDGWSLARVKSPVDLEYLIRPKAGPGQVRTIYEGRDELLLGGTFGLARLLNADAQALPAQRFPAFRDISGIVQTSGGETWLSAPAGILRLSTASLSQAFTDPRKALAPLVLDFRDGLTGSPGADSVRDVVQGGDGRLWFNNSAGTVWVDPARVSRNPTAPPVAISRLSSGGSSYRDPVRLSLPSGTTSLAITFAALSLTIPERVRVLYRLEGADAGWINPGLRRQAFYTNLGPGHYVFRVVAANNDGVWNRSGASLSFDIPPTFIQSGWFVALCAIGIGLLLWFAYALRLRQVTANVRGRLEERVAERERIARDLHDTLLQGFQGLILRFQSVANTMPEGERSRLMMDRALDSADDVFNEGRDSVRQLRSVGPEELSLTLTNTATRHRIDNPVEFKMVVEGVPRALNALVQEELGRIGDEAVTNAFRHARATTIEVVISYHRAALMMGVRDDGIGIDPQIASKGGRDGHFGLIGMRERALQIDAELKIASRSEHGTEILVRVPAGIAYLGRGRWRRQTRRMLSGLGPRR